MYLNILYQQLKVLRMENSRKERTSNIELLRILMMLVIVAHHYIVNSGITTYIASENAYNIFS